MKKFDYTFREGLPGGPNEVKGRVKGSVTKTGYKRNSPDVHNDFNVIPSPYITMVGVDFPVYGEDNLGNGQMMYPGENYEFPGDYVTEMPAYGSGGLTQWFAEEWVDVKTGKKCGRSGKDKNGRPYPACRPSKRVNKTTPKTTKEMSSAEKAKFKRSKTSSKRINYNHQRAQEGIEVEPEGYTNIYGDYIAPGDTLYSGAMDPAMLRFQKRLINQNSGGRLQGQYTVMQEHDRAGDKMHMIYTPYGYDLPVPPAPVGVQAVDLLKEQGEKLSKFAKGVKFNSPFKKQYGDEVGNRFLPPAIRNMQPKEDPIYYDGIVGETTVTAPRYEGPQIRRLLPGEGDPTNSNFSFIGADKSGGIGALKAIGKGVKGLLGLKSSADDAYKYVQGIEDFRSAAPTPVPRVTPKPATAGYKKGFGNPYENFKVTDDLFQGRPFYGVDYDGQIAKGRLDFVRNLGKELDDVKFDANWVGPEHLRFHGTPGGRSVVEVAVPGKTHQTQLFYKSTALGGKSGEGVAGTTQGLWQPYGGHATIFDSQGPITDWFIKDSGYKTYYNSKSYRDIANRLDDLAKEAGFDLSGQAYKYQEGGEPDPEMMFRDEYNTLLKPAEERRFNRWVTKESKRQGRDILMDMGAYDVRGFWKSGDHKRMDQDNHGSDAWKKPNHPTFSNQSRYHGTDGWYGGNWTEDAGYQPSKQTLQLYTPDYYKWMFGTEPNRPEHLDMSRYESGINTPTPMYYQQGGSIPKAQTGKEIAEVANQMVLNGEDGTRPPLNLIDNMVALFDKDGVCRDNTCVNVVKDIYKRAGYDVIPEGVYNNRAFRDDYDSYGLQLVAPQNKGRYILDDLQSGDIIQYRHDANSGGPLGKEGYPFHLGVYDENGQYISDGSKDDPIKKQSVFYYDDGTSKPPFDVFRLKQLGGSIPKAQEGGSAGTYSVKPGDTFYGIANRTGIDARTLQFNNPGIDINKIKPGQVLNVPGLMGPNPVSTQDVVEDKKEEKVKPSTDAYGFNDLLYRQAYQESRFDPTAVSPKGYKGFTQLGKGLMQDYAGATGDKRNDPFDPDYAIAVQKWAMDKYLNNTGWIKGSDKVKQAKALAAYNWGPGNTLRFLNSQKEKGVDIYSDDLPWLESLPGETKGYINNILNIEPSIGWEDAFRKDTTDSKYSKYYRQSGGETLYDYVKGLGYSPTFKNRKQIFGDYFQEEYKGTAKQNIELLNKLKAGDLNIDQYAEKANVQRVAEPVIQQPVIQQPVQQSMQQPVQQVQTPLPVQETPTQKSSYRGSASLSTDDDLNKVRQGLVKRANDIINGKADPYRLPSNVANIVKQQKHNGRYKNPDNYTCIGGVCTLLKGEGVIDEVITSNTEFARVANKSGFSKRSFKLENLKEADLFQHMGAVNESGTPYPTHIQMYLGRDEDGNYMFFDNWEITSDKYTPDGSKDGLKKYSPQKMKTLIEKGEQDRLNGAYFLHLNKEDAYDPEEQAKRARAQKNKARRLPGELYIDEQYGGEDYYQEIQSSQDVPYIYRGKKEGSGFENDLVGLFNNSEMDERMKSTFGITEQTLNDIKPLVYGIISQESNMDRGARFEGAEGLLDKTRKSGRQIKYKLENIIAPTGVGDLSYGPGSVRWSGLRRGAKKEIGKRKNITTPEGSYFAIVDLLLQSANSAERYVGEDLNPDLLDKNPWYPALYAYNGQMSGNRKGKTWGLKKGYTFEGSSYSADPGSYPMKVQGYADQLKRFVPVDYEPTIDNYYDPRYVPVVKPKGK